VRGAALYAPRDILFEEREPPKIVEPTDAVIRMSATRVRGPDLWRAAADRRADGDPAPVRRYLPQLIDLVLNGKIDSGKVLDLTLPLDPVAERYRTTDERRAIKALLRP
jgi:threonine dehydrogenase-like Zn-dependent dehydrogenase